MIVERASIAYRKCNSRSTLLDDNTTPFSLVHNTKKYKFSRPCVITVKNKSYLFAEIYDRMRFRSFVGCCELTDDGLGEWKPVLRPEYSLHAPSLFHFQRRVYMVADSRRAKGVVIYKAKKFPYQWKKFKTAIPDCKAADTAFFRFNGTPLFINTVNNPSPHLELHKVGSYYDLLLPLPKNVLNDAPVQGVYPYKYGIRYTKAMTYRSVNEKFRKKNISTGIMMTERCTCADIPKNAVHTAGRPFVYRGKVIRPVKIGDMNHGTHLDFYKITAAEPQSGIYREEFLCRVRPHQIKTTEPSNHKGITAYSFDGKYEVVELAEYKKRYFPWLYKLYVVFMKLIVKLFIPEPKS